MTAFGWLAARQNPYNMIGYEVFNLRPGAPMSLHLNHPLLNAVSTEH